MPRILRCNWRSHRIVLLIAVKFPLISSLPAIAFQLILTVFFEKAIAAIEFYEN
ncbi:MAG: hypothetical protein AB4290_15285 [Spirulina sp.]